jgi:plasmid stabilization system protein ParE
MEYRVAVADSAKDDADAIYTYVTEAAPVRGAEWFEELLKNLQSLAKLPKRCPLAREAEPCSS